MPKGAIVLIPFPFTDLSGTKVRPCLVLSDMKNAEDCIVACISSVRPKRLNEFDLLVRASKANGLKMDSIIKIAKIATLQKKIILGEIGSLESSYMRTINAKLKRLLQIV